MPLNFEDRPSDSPFVDRVWRSTSTDIGEFVSIASAHWSLVLCERAGHTQVTVQGPETHGALAPVPPDASFVGIRFRLGTILAGLPVRSVIDDDADLPDATSRSFYWKGSAWRRPDYDNAEALVERLAQADLLGSDPVVDEVLRDGGTGLSLRSVQRRFVAATGLSHGAIRQIERARQAAVRLREGTGVADVAHQLGYYDQPHLTRSLRRFIGRTPASLGKPDGGQLSLLYKTDDADFPTLAFDTLANHEGQRHEESRSGNDDHAEWKAGRPRRLGERRQ